MIGIVTVKFGCRTHCPPGAGSARVSCAPSSAVSHVDVLFPEELYGDFEDLETGDVHKGASGLDTQV